MRRRPAQEPRKASSPKKGGSIPVLVYEALAHDERTDEPFRKFPAPGWLEDWIALRRKVLNPANLWLWLWALLWEAAAIYFHTWCAKIVYKWGIVEHGMIGTPPLFDRVHESVPNLQWMRVVPEVGITTPVLFLGGLMLYNFDERSLDCFRTCLWTHGTILIARALSFSTTLLPDASQQCHTSLFVGGCHDLVFSGHTAIMIMAAAASMHFFFLHPAVRVVIVLNAIVQSFLVAASRNHYTVDVVVAIIVALLAYVAFTRHPSLVALTTFVPAKVLSKPSILTCGAARRRRQGRSSCCLCDPYDADTGLRLGRDGYEIVSPDDADAPQLIAEHAHAALLAMGYRPRFVLRRRTAKASGVVAAVALQKRRAAAAPRSMDFDASAVDERYQSDGDGEVGHESVSQTAALVRGDEFSDFEEEDEDGARDADKGSAGQWEWEDVRTSQELAGGSDAAPARSGERNSLRADTSSSPGRPLERAAPASAPRDVTLGRRPSRHLHHLRSSETPPPSGPAPSRRLRASTAMSGGSAAHPGACSRCSHVALPAESDDPPATATGQEGPGGIARQRRRRVSSGTGGGSRSTRSGSGAPSSEPTGLECPACLAQLLRQKQAAAIH